MTHTTPPHDRAVAPRHLLSLADLTPDEFVALLTRAKEVKNHASRYMRALYEKTLLMIFEAPSLRTRLSLETAMTQLHGHAINYYTIHSPWGHGKETIEDVARTISRYCDAVSARVFSHLELQKLAEHATVPVINAMTNAGHPCQLLGDFLTIAEIFDTTRGLKIAYLGDGQNNVTYSLMRAATLTDNHVVVACPSDPAYYPIAEVLAEIHDLEEQNGGHVEITDDPALAMRGADVVYTDSWMSYRVPLEEMEQRCHDLSDFRVDAPLLSLAKESAVFMHCLPAMRGMEVTAEVIDGARSVVFDQAENRLHIEKAVLIDYLGGGPDL